MAGFDKKVKYLNSLFIYKFKIYDYVNQKIKIYYISPDNQHNYLIIDAIPSSNSGYLCEIGELYFNEEKRMTFEDTPSEVFFVDNSDFKQFNKITSNIPSWTDHKIKEIIEANFEKDLSF